VSFFGLRNKQPIRILIFVSAVIRLGNRDIADVVSIVKRSLPKWIIQCKLSLKTRQPSHK